MKSKRHVMITLAFIMIVNALSYTTLLPLLNTYSEKFGINEFWFQILIATYSISQFFFTPLLGRISDKYGRKPVLALCLLGTAVSLGMMAMARNAVELFIARFLDGLTGANVSVAHAIVSDSAKGNERTKGFGWLGAAGGIGLVLGPALGGLLAKQSLTAPLWFSAALSLLAMLGVFLFLPESLSARNKEHDKAEPLFHFSSIFQAVFYPVTGILLMINFLSAISINALLGTMQLVIHKNLGLEPKEIGIFLSVLGSILVLMQVFGISAAIKKFKSKEKILFWSLLLSSFFVSGLYFFLSLVPFVVLMIMFIIFAAFREPIVSTLITERTKGDDQGEILGINQSYLSLGQIFGPITAAFVGNYSVPAVFLVAGLILFVATWMSYFVPIKKGNKLDL